jgi:hypothetical protein
MDIEGIGYDGVDCLYQAEDKVHWDTLMVLNLRTVKWSDLLTRSAIVNFSRRTVFTAVSELSQPDNHLVTLS